MAAFQPIYPRKYSTHFVFPQSELHIQTALSALVSTAAARIQSQVRSCGVCGGQSDTGAGFLRVLRFPLAVITPRAAPYLCNHPIIDTA
jgi:hypothetical protein